MSAPMANQQQGILMRIMPSCKDMAKQSTMINTVGIILSIIIFILIVIVLVWMYMPYKGTNEEILAEKEKRMKNSGVMLIVTIILVFLNVGVNVWQVGVNKKVNECINPKQ